MSGFLTSTWQIALSAIIPVALSVIFLIAAILATYPLQSGSVAWQRMTWSARQSSWCTESREARVSVDLPGAARVRHRMPAGRSWAACAAG